MVDFKLDGHDGERMLAAARVKARQETLFNAPEVLKGQRAFDFSAPQLDDQAEDADDPAPECDRCEDEALYSLRDDRESMWLAFACYAHAHEVFADFFRDYPKGEN